VAKEIQAMGPAGVTLYAQVWNTVGQVWSTVAGAFVAYASANVADYDVPMAQEGAASGVYTADFPEGIPAGIYSVRALRRAGGAPAETDQVVAIDAKFVWTGTRVATIHTPPEAAGRPADAEGMLRRAFEWVENERTRERGTGTVELKDAAGTGVLSTQTQSTAAGLDKQTKGA
jgi:hypothetical protein